MSVRLKGSGPNSPEHETLRHSVSTLLNPVAHRHDIRQETRDRVYSLRESSNTHHNRNYIRHNNHNIQNNLTAVAPVLGESSQVPGRGMIVGMALVNKRKPCDLRASVVFSGFELIHLGSEPEELVWQTNFGPKTLR